MAKFNPQQHMTNLKGKDYLEVKWRLVWFRDEHPQGSITTEVVQCDPVIVIRAQVHNADGVIMASGIGSCVPASGKVYAGREFEKAETAAIGRALAHAGFGTQFSDDDDDLVHLADAPIERGKAAVRDLAAALGADSVTDLTEKPMPSGKPWTEAEAKNWLATLPTPHGDILTALEVKRFGEWNGDAASATARVRWYAAQRGA